MFYGAGIVIKLTNNETNVLSHGLMSANISSARAETTCRLQNEET